MQKGREGWGICSLPFLFFIWKLHTPATYSAVSWIKDWSTYQLTLVTHYQAEDILHSMALPIKGIPSSYTVYIHHHEYLKSSVERRDLEQWNQSNSMHMYDPPSKVCLSQVCHLVWLSLLCHGCMHGWMGFSSNEMPGLAIRGNFKFIHAYMHIWLYSVH